jgi:hypothetical protein
MNGRVYDYNLGRFLSVDPFVQDPGNSQSINPYSYIMNNPLAGTDPTGYVSETAEFELEDVKNVEIYEDGSVTVNFNNGAESQSFSNASISDGNSTVDIGSQMKIAKRDAAISKDAYREQSAFGKDSSVQRLGNDQLKDLGLEDLPFEDSDSGFQSSLYHDSERDEYIYAFAGTDPLTTDNLENFAQAVGKFSTQYDLAFANTKAIRSAVNGNVSLTGHSLGGGLAAMSSTLTGLSANTFNAAGVHMSTLARYAGGLQNAYRLAGGTKTHNFHVVGDFLTGLQNTSAFSPALPSALGRQTALFPTPLSAVKGMIPIYGGLHLHSMDTVIGSMR